MGSSELLSYPLSQNRLELQQEQSTAKLYEWQQSLPQWQEQCCTVQRYRDRCQDQTKKTQQCKCLSKSLEIILFYNLTFYNTYHKACITQQFSNTSQLIISASETTSPMLFILFLKKLVGETCNKHWFSNFYSPVCLLHHMGKTLILLHSELKLNSSEQLQQQKKGRLGFSPSTQVTSPKQLGAQRNTLVPSSAGVGKVNV